MEEDNLDEFDGFDEQDNLEIERLEHMLNIASADHEAAAIIHVKPLAQMLAEDPDKGIEMIFDAYNKGLDFAYTHAETGENCRSYIEAVAGGPCEIVPTAIYNAVGSVYPMLTREQKDRALGKIISIFSKLNYTIVQDFHTSYIRNPLLLSDIQIAKHIYWPGLGEGKRLIEKYDSFFELKEELITEEGRFRHKKVDSDFVVAYSLLRSDMCDYGEEYAGIADKRLLYKTVKGIVAMRFARAKDENEIKEGIKRLQELLPGSLHPRIEPLRQAGGWVDYKKFP